MEVADPEFLRLSFIKEFNSMPNRNDVNFGTYFDNFMTALTDDRWRHVRSSMTPTFTSGKLKGVSTKYHCMYPCLKVLMTECIITNVCHTVYRGSVRCFVLSE